MCDPCTYNIQGCLTGTGTIAAFTLKYMGPYRSTKQSKQNKPQHYDDVIPCWRLKTPASRLFTQSFIQALIKENIKAPRHWPLCGKFTGDRWISRTNGQLRGKCFHLMTSSWQTQYFRSITLRGTHASSTKLPFRQNDWHFPDSINIFARYARGISNYNSTTVVYKAIPLDLLGQYAGLGFRQSETCLWQDAS